MANDNWQDDSIQFPRLIAELEAAGAFTKEVVKDLCASMDLNEDEVMELIDRAQNEWDKIVRNNRRVGKIVVPKEILEKMESYCENPPGSDNCNDKDFPLFDKEYVFADGMRMAVQVCPTTEPDNDPCWTQGVLFDKEGNELGRTDVGESFEGEYEIEHDGKLYVVIIEEARH